jgi:hypothetical protein
MKIWYGIAAAAAAFTMVAPASATLIPGGTLSTADLFAPAVNLAPALKTFTVKNGKTAEIAGNGGFLSAVGPFPAKSGIMNGVVKFSPTVGTTVAQVLTNFLVFNDGKGGTFNFSASSVQTLSYVNTSSTKSFALFLLGKTQDTHLGYAPTDSTLTLTFNKTGGSPYSSSATLAVPYVPEPASWMMMLGGFGVIGGALRARKRNVAVAFG